MRRAIVESKQLVSSFRDGLYFFFCQPLMQQGKIEECKFRWHRPACLKCLFHAGKALYYDYRRR